MDEAKEVIEKRIEELMYIVANCKPDERKKIINLNILLNFNQRLLEFLDD